MSYQLLIHGRGHTRGGGESSWQSVKSSVLRWPRGKSHSNTHSGKIFVLLSQDKNDDDRIIQICRRDKGKEILFVRIAKCNSKGLLYNTK